MSLLSRFIQYQNERFPLKILLFTTLAVVLSSGAVLSFEVSWHQILWNILACLAFLYHIRVIDESRDQYHDDLYHKDRPVQRGLISIRELFTIDIGALLLFSVVSVAYGWVSFFYGLMLLLFSYVAWKDFFLGEKLKRHFYLYNGINMLQMVLLQLFIYGVFTASFAMSKVMWIHLLFVIFNTIIMEFVRKIKTSDKENRGKDTYSWHLGYARSLYIFYFFSVINFLTFVWMIYAISPGIKSYLLVALFLLIMLTLSVVLHLYQKKKSTENFLLLSTVLNYVGLNLLIYSYNLTWL